MKLILSYPPLSPSADKRTKRGFTILEIMVAMSIFLVVVLLVGSIFSLAQRAYTYGAASNELTQNLRVFFDRASRELRQSNYLVTDISATSSEIVFQDGHHSDYISYIRYYLSGTDLYRSHIAYYFGSWPVADPSEYVRHDATDEFGQPASSAVLSDQIIGEYFTAIGFYGNSGMVNISAELAKAGLAAGFGTKIYLRNW